MTSAREAREWLIELGAPRWLVRHHDLVVEAATALCDGVHRAFGAAFDRELVLAGAAIHDIGKLVHPDEMHAPGHAHERAGEQLLLARGVAPELAAFCVSHAAWDRDDARIEDLLVALADKLWKGQRPEALEQRLAARLADATRRARWEVFEALDTICEQIAAEGPDRLARSVE